MNITKRPPVRWGVFGADWIDGFCAAIDGTLPEPIRWRKSYGQRRRGDVRLAGAALRITIDPHPATAVYASVSIDVTPAGRGIGFDLHVCGQPHVVLCGRLDDPRLAAVTAWLRRLDRAWAGRLAEHCPNWPIRPG